MIKRILLTALFATNAFAHDFWIEPSTFDPQPGKTFTVALRVGELWHGSGLQMGGDGHVSIRCRT